MIIEGENLDAALGTAILHHAPKSSDRPRWERVLDFARGLGSQGVIGLFFINSSRGDTPWPFVAAVQNAGFRAILLAGTSQEKVVDVGIQRTLEALLARECDVLVAPATGTSPRRLSSCWTPTTTSPCSGSRRP